MTTSSWRIPLAALLVAAAATTSLRSQTPRPMGIVDLLNVPRLAEPQLSPDGRDVLLHPSRCGLEGGQTDHAHLAGARRRRRSRVQLTSGADGETAPRWSPDGKTIAFTREARRRRVRADLPAADRRRRGASADDPRQRGVRHRPGRPTARRSTSRRPTPRAPTKRRARSARRRLRATTRTSSRRTCGRSTVAIEATRRRVTDGDFSVDRLRPVG